MSKYQTCAHSAPWQPPIPLDDEEKGYPVGRFCKHACRSMAVIRDPEVCESCTQYDKVFVHYLVVQGCQDEDVMATVRDRQDTHEAVMSALKARIKRVKESAK